MRREREKKREEKKDDKKFSSGRYGSIEWRKRG